MQWDTDLQDETDVHGFVDHQLFSVKQANREPLLV